MFFFVIGACQNARQMQDKIIRKLNLLINLITNPETNQMVTTKKFQFRRNPIYYQIFNYQP